ncbi:MAG: hypothetical protein WAL91_12480, partial [Propionicimonas sp.]
YGWLTDRLDTKHRRNALTGPPDRAIPGLAEDAAAPAYRTQDELLHGPDADRQASPSPESADALLARLAAAPDLTIGHASSDFANFRGFDRPGQHDDLCVLNSPRVLVADAEITSVRELLGFLGRARADRVPVVIISSSMAEEVLSTLRVNSVQGKVPAAVVLVPDDAERARLAVLVGATAVGTEDLRADFLPATTLGTCDTWVSTTDRLWVLND